MALIYLHKRKIDGEVFYIGISKNKERAFSKKSRSLFWKRYTDKYEFFVEILSEKMSWDDACEAEKELICFYGRRDLELGNLLNLTDGGEGTLNPSEEVIKGRIIIMKGNNYGLGYKFTDNQRNNLKQSLIGNTRSVGRTHPKEVKYKISKALNKSVSQYNKKEELINNYPSITEASKINNISGSHITKVCKNTRKTAGGFIWKYENSKNNKK